MRERIEAMKAIWMNDVAKYHGSYVNFEPMWAWPKPIQKPYPPIILGGAFPHAARRAIAYGDGWMPIGRPGMDMLSFLPRFRQMIAEAGRDYDTVPMSVILAQPDAGLLKGYAGAGIDRAVLLIQTGGREEVLRKLDEYSKLMHDVAS
jgi:alkanesulfonate monooxygenase SsuD/methylene tetrahydromethanopterin reductase-like flavin-dependent oxidoreductase (luciferase family)